MRMLLRNTHSAKEQVRDSFLTHFVPPHPARFQSDLEAGSNSMIVTPSFHVVSFSSSVGPSQFNKRFLRNYYKPGTVLGSRSCKVKRTLSSQSFQLSILRRVCQNPVWHSVVCTLTSSVRTWTPWTQESYTTQLCVCCGSGQWLVIVVLTDVGRIRSRMFS